MRNQRVDSYERLAHIQKAINMIEAFSRDINKEAFLNNQLIVSAVLFQFSVIGEALIHVEEDLLSKYEYPWHKVRAFRNLISHVYFQIKLEAVWNIIVKDLPELKQRIETILKNEF
ncbi:MAG: DUF86 domain-containing protein [Bacteroidales bacterium]|nr:DUF86 domain-containing protein [Bacteroidales bacterium]